MTKGAKAKGSAGGAAKPVSGYMKAATAGVGLVGAAALGRSAYNQYQDRRYYAPRAVDARAARMMGETGRARFEEQEREHEARAAAELAEHDRRIALADAQVAAARARQRRVEEGIQAINRGGAHAQRAHQVPTPHGHFHLHRQHSPAAVNEWMRQRIAKL